MVVRFAVIVALLGMSIIVAMLWRFAVSRSDHRLSENPALAKLPPELSDGARFLLFTSRYCIPCAELKEALAASGSEWKEVRVEDNPSEFRRLGILATPVLVEVSDDGAPLRHWGPESVGAALEALRNITALSSATLLEASEPRPDRPSPRFLPGESLQGRR